MKIPIFCLFFMICSLVKSQTEINFFNEFLLGYDNKNFNKILSTNKVANMSKTTLDYHDTKPDTVKIEELEFYKNGIMKQYLSKEIKNIFKKNYKYCGTKFISGSISDQNIDGVDTMVVSYSQLYKYKRNKRVRISKRGDHYIYQESDSTIYTYKKKKLIYQQRYIQEILVYKEEYFYNRNNRLDSILFLSQDSSISKIIYYYDKQLRLMKKIDTKSKSALNYDTDYIFKTEYQYNDNDQIALIKKYQLSNLQETFKITTIKYLENNQVEIWREKDSMYEDDTKEVYFFSDKLLLLKVMNYNFKNEVWELTSEETYDYTYFK